MGHLSANTTFLCGAGASQGSGLPDGQALAALAFDHVWTGANVYPMAALDAVHDALRWPPAGEPRLRLELILDLMAKEIKADVLAGIYSVLLGASPCLAHYALAATGMPIVTTNQDELIEDAAAKLSIAADVMHLHGLASRPHSIVTMLSQYVDGLPPAVAQQLGDRLTGCHLVVLGYSGRDLDIMPHLYQAPRVTWLHFHRLVAARPQRWRCGHFMPSSAAGCRSFLTPPQLFGCSTGFRHLPRTPCYQPPRRVPWLPQVPA